MSHHDHLAARYGLTPETSCEAFKDTVEICLEEPGPSGERQRVLHCFRVPSPEAMGRLHRSLTILQQEGVATEGPKEAAYLELLEDLYQGSIENILGYKDADGRAVDNTYPSWQSAAPRHHRLLAAAGLLRKLSTRIVSEKKSEAACGKSSPGNEGRNARE